MTVIPTLLTRELRPGGGVGASSSLGPPAPVWAADSPHPLLSFSPRISACLSSPPLPHFLLPPRPCRGFPGFPVCRQDPAEATEGRRFLQTQDAGGCWCPCTPAALAAHGTWRGRGRGWGAGHASPCLWGALQPCREERLGWWTPKSCGPPNLMSSVAGYHFRLPWSG